MKLSVVHLILSRRVARVRFFPDCSLGIFPDFLQFLQEILFTGCALHIILNYYS